MVPRTISPVVSSPSVELLSTSCVVGEDAQVTGGEVVASSSSDAEWIAIPQISTNIGAFTHKLIIDSHYCITYLHL